MKNLTTKHDETLKASYIDWIKAHASFGFIDSLRSWMSETEKLVDEEAGEPPSSIDQTIEEREKERHGCCCAGCSLRAELWVAFAVDVLTLGAMAKELPLLPEAKFLELSKFAQIFKINFPTLYEICANSSKLRFEKSFKLSLEDSKKSDEI